MVEEFFNSISHGFGVILAIWALILYFLQTPGIQDTWKVVGVSIFGISLVLLYLTSTLCHGLIFTKARRLFLQLDYCAIFILIAATYTPFLLTDLRGPLGWYMLGVTWAVAIGGVLLQLIYFEKVAILSLILYLSLGWMMVFAYVPLFHVLPLSVTMLLFAGGLLYTTGVVFLLAKKLPFGHTIWHIFVIFGSACHFLAISLL